MSKCPICGCKAAEEVYQSTRPGQPPKTMRRVRCLKTRYSGTGCPRQVCPIIIEEVEPPPSLLAAPS